MSCCKTSEPGVCQRMTGENWTVFIEDSWERWLRSSDHTKYPTINCTRSQEQSHRQSPVRRGDQHRGMEAAGTRPRTVLQERRRGTILKRGPTRYSEEEEEPPQQVVKTSEWRHQAHKRRWHHLSSNTPRITSQSTEPLHKGQEQKALVKDCTASCKIGLFQVIKMKHAS